MPRQSRSLQLIPRILLGLAGLFLLIQLVPYGRTHTNPPVQTTPSWDTPQTKALFARACADCHSNETKWPWYSNVAPLSWFLQQHVNEGRSTFNASIPGFGEEAGEAAEAVENGGMPLSTYLPLHPEARLTEAEQRQLIVGLTATFGSEGDGAANHR